MPHFHEYITSYVAIATVKQGVPESGLRHHHSKTKR